MSAERPEDLPRAVGVARAQAAEHSRGGAHAREAALVSPELNSKRGPAALRLQGIDIIVGSGRSLQNVVPVSMIFALDLWVRLGFRGARLRAPMFFRLKTSGQRGYVQIVENRREGAAVRQRVIANLGRADELVASGALASLIASGARLTDQVLLIAALDEDADGALSVAAKRIGGPMLFGRIWERLGIDAVLDDLLKDRAFGFAVERAVFVATLHRLFVSGSDRDCSSWMADYDLPGAEGGSTRITSTAPWRGSAKSSRRSPPRRSRRAASRT